MERVTTLTCPYASHVHHAAERRRHASRMLRHTAGLVHRADSARTLVRDPSRTRLPGASSLACGMRLSVSGSSRCTRSRFTHTTLSPHMIASTEYDCSAKECASELATRVPGKM